MKGEWTVKVTVSELITKIDRIRTIVERIEKQVPIETYMDEIADLLDEYAMLLRERKVEL